jgi:hypothetical protein
VLWRIHQAPDSQVIAVIAEGDGAVAVTGVKASVPLLISSTNYGRMSNCRTLEADKQLSRLNIQLTSDVKGDKVYATSRETIPFVIGPKLSADKYEESGDITPSQYTLAR